MIVSAGGGKGLNRQIPIVGDTVVSGARDHQHPDNRTLHVTVDPSLHLMLS